MNESQVADVLRTTELLDYDDNWNLTKLVASIIDEPLGREIIIHVLDIWKHVNSDAKLIWLDLIERAGFYPYYVEKINNQYKMNSSIQSEIRTAYFKSEFLPNVYFHEEQKKIEQAISRGKNIAVSAPTSFGKSLLIEEVVAKNKYDNILIIQPTLALIDETRRKMRKYSDNYNLIVNTRQEIKEKNIFILTAERVLEVVDFPKIDFFVIDEFYKISNRRKNDKRIDALNVAMLRIMNMAPQAMFLTPTVDSLSEKFKEKYDIDFFKTDYALVNTNVIEVRNKNGNPYTSSRKKEELFKLLREQTEPSIVYVKTPNEAYKLANEYLKWLHPKDKKNPRLDIFEWIDVNISDKWQLKKMLENGLGVHNGGLPRHILTSEIELFNNKNLDVLFATASLIEGVNTAAKNMFIFSPNKGKAKIDSFDFANIKGRAGRMGQYYTGNVYVFNEELKPENFVIDVPVIDQIDVSDEILINIPDKDIRDCKRVTELKENLDDEVQEIIKRNLISVSGQKELYKYLEEECSSLDYLKWNQMPSYEQLWQTIHLGYRFLSNNNNLAWAQKTAVTALDLVKLPLKEVIEKNATYLEGEKKKDPINASIYETLNFQREYANFKIPKLLAVIESIQKYVFQKHNHEKYGEYSYFAARLENDKVPERLQFLADYGVPSSAIIKLNKMIPPKIDSDQALLNYIRENKISIENNLISYEKNLLSKTVF